MLAQQADILRNILLDGAGRHAGGDVAVQQRQRLASINALFRLPLFLGVVHAHRFFRQRVEALDIDLRHVPAVGFLQLAHALAQAQISSRLQQVGGHGDRANTGVENLANVELAGAAGVGDRQLAVKRPREQGGHVDREREQRAPGHIHFIPGQRPLVVDGAEGVGQLDAKAEAALLRQRHQARQHLQRPVDLKVVVKRRFAKADIAEAAGVEDLAHARIAEQGRIELHKGIEIFLGQHIAADGFDLIRRAAVHRREGDALDQPGRYALRQVVQPVFARACWQAVNKGFILQPAVQRVAVLGEFRMRGGVHHVVDKFLHRRLLNTVKVVADAHIENKRLALFVRRQRKDLLQQMQGEPGFQVLIPGFFQGKFSGPFGIEALIFRIDTGLFQLQAVKDLNGFQLYKTPAG